MSRFVLETDSVSLASVKVASAGERLRRHGDEIGTAIDVNLDGLPADFKTRAGALRGRLDTTRAAAQTYTDKGAALSAAIQGFIAAGTTGGTTAGGSGGRDPGTGKHGSGSKTKGSHGSGGHKGNDVDHKGLGDAIGAATAIGIAGAAGGIIVRSPSLTKAIAGLLSPKAPGSQGGYTGGSGSGSGGKAGSGSSTAGGASRGGSGPKTKTRSEQAVPANSADAEFGIDGILAAPAPTHPVEVQTFVKGPIVFPKPVRVETFVPGPIVLPAMPDPFGPPATPTQVAMQPVIRQHPSAAADWIAGEHRTPIHLHLAVLGL